MRYLLILALLGGCGAPAVSSSMRTNFTAEQAVTTRCVHRQSTFKEREGAVDIIEFAAKKGWRLSYTKEYKGSMRRKYDALYCFERRN